MGQAKRRGTLEERYQAARSKIDALRPTTIICNSCQKETTDIHVMDTRNMVGITAAFAGLCECGRSTFALLGDTGAVADFAMSLEASMGEEMLLGSQLIPRK